MQSHSLFLNDWNSGTIDTLKTCFGITDRDLQGVEILLASYTRDECQGDAFVLFVRNGVLYEVNASHDSVDNLVGQWEPEDTFIRALQYRLDKGNLGLGANGANLYADELRFLLVELERKLPPVSEVPEDTKSKS